jgi:hypothetical protein
MYRPVRINRLLIAASKALLGALEEMAATAHAKSRGKQKRKPRRYYYRETRISR